MEQVERQTGVTPEELATAPLLPECAAHVWGWFIALSAKRQNGMSVNPISEEAAGWYFFTRKIMPQQWELDAIDAIDAALLASIHEDTPKK